MRLKCLYVCAGVPLFVSAAAVVCGKTSAFGVDGGIAFGLLFFFFLQPLSAFVCGAASERGRYPLWFAFPIFAGLIGAATPPAATGNDPELFFFLCSFIPGLLGMGAALAAGAIKTGAAAKRSAVGK